MYNQFKYNNDVEKTTGHFNIVKRTKLIYSVVIIRGTAGQQDKEKGLSFCGTTLHTAAHSEPPWLCAGSSFLPLISPDV